jgi:ketopantoate reductase
VAVKLLPPVVDILDNRNKELILMAKTQTIEKDAVREAIRVFRAMGLPSQRDRDRFMRSLKPTGKLGADKPSCVPETREDSSS